MKELFSRFAFLVVCAFWFCASGAAPESPTLKVMSYNLRLDAKGDPMEWPERRHLMVELIQQTNPDVIGTQEGLYHQLKFLGSSLKGYDWIGLGREGGSRGEFMAIFYRQDRLEPMAYDHFWLSDTPEVIGSTTWGNRVKRMVTWVQFKDLKTSQLFYLVNTHFDHQVQLAREKSAELLRARIGKLDPSLPLLLTGDFNCVTSNPAYKTLTANAFLKDTWYDAQRRKGEDLDTFNGWKEVKRNSSRIDWILYCGNITVDLAEIVDWSKNGHFPSDHCPVVANVRLNGGK